MPRWDSCILANCSKTRRNKTICNRLKKKYVEKGIDAFKHGNQAKDRQWLLFEFQHFCKSSNDKKLNNFVILLILFISILKNTTFACLRTPLLSS